MDKNTADKTKILEQALKNIPFDGWSIATFEAAAVACGFDKTMVAALFSHGKYDTLSFFAKWADDKMMVALKNIDTSEMRVHEKIALAVGTRIGVLSPYKDCVRESAKIMANPQYYRTATQITWDTADVIWDWAGDTSADYNRYTKRGLLSGVIGSTMLYWLQDDSDNHEKTTAFLNRRIQNVLFVGKNAAPLIKPVARLFERFIVRKPSK